MGVNPHPIICEGSLDKRCERKLIGPGWKRRFCQLTSEALILYRSRSRAVSRSQPVRTVPLCHIKAVERGMDDPASGCSIFEVLTEQGETIMFRCKDGVGWAAQIQIQLIHYKNRQDILRYKQLNNSMAVAENVIQRCANGTHARKQCGIDPNIRRRICPNKGYRTVVLPNHKHSGMGIGITVVTEDDGRVLVNRVLDGGPAFKLGVLKPKDEIVSVNAKPVVDVDNLLKIVNDCEDAVTFVIKPHVAKPSSPKDDLMIEKQNAKTKNLIINPRPLRERGFNDEDCVFKFT